MIAVFTRENEIIIVGLNADGNPMDQDDGTLFGPESGRDIEDFDREDVNIDEGQIAHIRLGAPKVFILE